MSLLLLAAIASMAAADRDDDVWDSKETREVQARYGECIVKKVPGAARNMVLDPNLDEGERRRAFRKVADGMCLIQATANYDGVEMKFPMDTMRYALADALFVREYSAGPVPAIKDAAPLEQPKFDETEFQSEIRKDAKKLKPEDVELRRAKQIGVVFLATYGECIVRLHPEKSHALLKTKPSTSEESAAFKALTPELSYCLPDGQQLSFGKTPLRGTIAMNFYRLAHAPRGVK